MMRIWFKPNMKVVKMPPQRAPVDLGTIVQRFSQLDSRMFRKCYTYGPDIDRRTCIWSAGGRYSWSDLSSGITWVAVHGVDQICVVIRKMPLDPARMDDNLKRASLFTVLVHFLKTVVADMGDQVNWTPYAEIELPVNLEGQEKYGLLLCPLCYMNNLMYHKPHFTSDQFPKLKGVHLDQLTWVQAELPFKQNSWQFAQNFEKIYEKQLQDWFNKKVVTDFLPQSEDRIEDDQSKKADMSSERESETAYTFHDGENFESEYTPIDRVLEEESDDVALSIAFAKQLQGKNIGRTIFERPSKKDSVEEVGRENTRKEGQRFRFCGGRGSENTRKGAKWKGKDLASATEEVAASRRSRIINNVYGGTNSYESGYNLALWRVEANNFLVNEVCKFISLDDIIIIQCSGHYASLKDCRFYKGCECVSDNYVRVAAYLYTNAWRTHFDKHSHRAMLDPTFSMRAIQGSHDLSAYTTHIKDIHYERINVVFVPVLLDAHWWCAAFSVNICEIMVIDSWNTINAASTHEFVLHKLQRDELSFQKLAAQQTSFYRYAKMEAYI
ncbi:hypothetical protein OROHE_021322 [Orobanche hederae]